MSWDNQEFQKIVNCFSSIQREGLAPELCLMILQYATILVQLLIWFSLLFLVVMLEFEHTI